MKFLLTLIFVQSFLLLISSGEYTVKTCEDLFRYHYECGSENNVPSDVWIRYLKQEFTDQNALCHVKCLANKFGIYSEENGFNFQNTLKQVAGAFDKPENQINDILVDCQKVADEFKENSCLSVSQAFACLLRNNYGLVKPCSFQ
uniref:CSON012498 protein n=1 Tax=Culicoides sonorensis TaxID=179676 RepID=A0A336M8A7_CULSO